MRRIPSTMATQHPDNAGAPYWEYHGSFTHAPGVKRDAFVSTQEELTECLSAYQDLGAEEYMWDWEGKYADETVIDKLFTKYYNFAKKSGLGKNKFLTFRVPNVWHEKGYSLIRSLMVMLTSEDFAKDLGFKNRPLFEIILPMTEKAEQLIYIQRAYQKLAKFKMATFSHQQGKNEEYLEVIPLVESVEGQMDIRALLEKYAKLHKKYFKNYPKYLRPFLARSDPAMVSGLIATVLSNKIALSEIARFSKHNHVPCHPIIGVGSLVFRGGFAPDTVKTFIKQYAGVKTLTAQSAYRYDYPLPAVKSSIKYLNHALPKSQAQIIPAAETNALQKVVRSVAKVYQATLDKVVSDMYEVFASVPSRRERKLHVGFLSYGRKMGKTKLPRAINFTAGFYSLGVPPEFIGLGRALAELNASELALVKKYYVTLKFELDRAGRFLNKANLRKLASRSAGWKLVERDVDLAEKLLSAKFGPKTGNEHLHANLTSQALIVKHNSAKLGALIVESGKLRRSLG